MNFTSITRNLLMAVVATSLSACGGSGDSGSSPTATVSGTVFAGPASGAKVKVKSVFGNFSATTTGSTDGTGSFTINLPATELSHDLTFETSGGTFPDEATATPVSLGTLRAYVPASRLTSGSQVTIDPASTIIHKLVMGGKNFTDAQRYFSDAFGYTPDISVKPVFANTSTVSNSNQRLAGLRAAAFSQLTKDLYNDPTRQFDLIQALADDLSDGTLDGKKGNNTISALPSDIGNKFGQAFINFAGGTNNKCKLAPAPPFNKVAVTSSYRLEYVTGATGDVAGKTAFQLKITNRSDGSPATGLATSIVLNPLMVMTSMSGGTNWPNQVKESSTPGTYDAVTWYSMATTDMSMYWKLSVKIGSETALFYPTIAPVSNGVTVRNTFKYSGDKTSATAVRSYSVWRDTPTAGTGGTYDFTLFLSTTDAGNSLPVTAGTQLTVNPLTISSVTLQASGDGSTWTSLTPVDATSGRYKATGLTNLNGKIYVNMALNGTVYTQDGNPAANTANIATDTSVRTFIVTETAAVAPLTVTTSSLPDATVGTFYTQTLTATGGTPPYQWTTMGGDPLPAGLTLNQNTGVLSGIPTASGVATIVFMITDANPATMVHKPLTITVK
jgi:Putative Ig domain